MKKVILSTLLLFIAILGNTQTNYYVSPAGSNGNTGSLATPWLTVQYGLNQMASGDFLNLMTGTYNEKIAIPISGLTLRNHTGQSPILDGGGLTAIPMIEIYDVSNIVIDGLEIQNNVRLDAQGILVDHNCQNITIQNCKIHDIHFSSDTGEAATASKNAQGIIVYGSDPANAITNLAILNNQLYDCRLGYSEGIAVNGNVDGFEVSGNVVHDLTNIGIDAIGHETTSSNPANDQARNGLIKNNTVYNCVSTYATSGGIYVDGGKSIVIENNTSYHNGYGIEVGCENLNKTTDNITVRNNIFYDNEVAAFALGGYNYPATTGKVINSAFRNNTCYFDDFSNDFIGELFFSYFENCTIENNIFFATNQNVALYHEGTAPITSSINYNIYYSNNLGSGIEFTYAGSSYEGVVAFNTGTAYEANGQQVDPDFAAPAISPPDFHLLSTSPAINAANPAFTPAGSEVDMDAADRKVDTYVDCGADEYPVVLAVEYLQALQATINNNQVQLNWSTAMEENSDYFEIERSSNTNTWEKVGIIKAANYSNTTQFYSIIDRNPLDKTNYYRLKQFDFGGTFSYSNTASAYFEKTNFSFYPNPTRGAVELSFSKNINAAISVSDLLGKIVHQSNLHGQQTHLDLSYLPNGIYLISVETQGERMNAKMVLRK